MKKKLLLSAVAVLATLGVSAGLAGCDLIDGIIGNKPGDNTGDTGNQGGNQDGSIIEKPSDIGNVKSEEVSEATWNSALSLSSFSNSKVVFSTTSVYDGTTYAMNYTGYTANNIYRGEMTTKSGSASVTVSVYIDYGKSPAVAYIKQGDGKWTKGTVSDCGQCTTENIVGMFLGAPMSQFTYSKSEGGYVTTEEGVSFIYKFSGGKFVAAHAEEGENKADLSAVYGGQSVTIPQSVITEANGGSGSGSGTTKPDDGKEPSKPDDKPLDPDGGNFDEVSSEEVTSRVWRSAFDISNFENSRTVYTADGNSSGASVHQTFESVMANKVEHVTANTKVSGMISSAQTLELYVDYKAYPEIVYARDGSKWTISNNGIYKNMTTEGMLTSMPSALTDYSAYSYDEKAKGYVAKGIKVESTVYNSTVKFSGGKVIGIEMVQFDNKGNEIGSINMYFTYGGQSVYIPKEVIAEANSSGNKPDNPDKPDDPKPVAPEKPQDPYNYEDTLPEWSKVQCDEGVSYKEWEEAFAEHNFMKCYKAAVNYYNEAGVDKHTVYVRGWNGYFYSHTKEDGDQMYLDLTTSPYTGYGFDYGTGNWVKYTSVYNCDPLYEHIEQILKASNDYWNYYNYEYDAEYGGYVLDNSPYVPASEAKIFVVKISGGRISGFQVYANNKETLYEVKIDYSEYVVEIPEYVLNEGNGGDEPVKPDDPVDPSVEVDDFGVPVWESLGSQIVSEEEWNRAFENYNFVGYRASCIIAGDLGYAERGYNGISHVFNLATGAEIYQDYNSNPPIEYYYNDGWQMLYRSADTDIICEMVGGTTVHDYVDFHYSEEFGGYVFERKIINDGKEILQTIVYKFSDGKIVGMHFEDGTGFVYEARIEYSPNEDCIIPDEVISEAKNNYENGNNGNTPVDPDVDNYKIYAGTYKLKRSYLGNDEYIIDNKVIILTPDGAAKITTYLDDEGIEIEQEYEGKYEAMVGGVISFLHWSESYINCKILEFDNETGRLVVEQSDNGVISEYYRI